MRADFGAEAWCVPAPTYSCGELEWIWARITTTCRHVDCNCKKGWARVWVFGVGLGCVWVGVHWVCVC